MLPYLTSHKYNTDGSSLIKVKDKVIPRHSNLRRASTLTITTRHLMAKTNKLIYMIKEK